MSDSLKEHDESARNPGKMKVKTPAQQTSSGKGSVKPVVAVQAAPLPRNEEDNLYWTPPPREEAKSAVRPRTKTGQYAKKEKA